MKVLLLVTALLTSAWAEENQSLFYDKRFSINFHNTPLREALQLIARKGHLHLKTESELPGKVDYAIKDSTLESAMEQIAQEKKLRYRIENDALYIYSQTSTQHSNLGRNVSAVSQPTFNEATGDINYHTVPVLYANIRDLTLTLQKNLNKGESIVGDEMNSTLIFYGSQESYNRIRSFVAQYDHRPLQILIEAQIVETSKNLARDLGISWGDLQPPGTGTPNLTGNVTTPSPQSTNLLLSGIIGSISSRTLEAKLLAAESSGDAKVVSRPKIYTLNNKKATIHSGITYHIKTLTAVTGATSVSSTGTVNTSNDSIAGGLREISSGLELDVTPTVVGDGLVRMIIKVQNSESDPGAAVDGIPGFDDNSADTSVLVKSGQTATIAGLVKKSVSTSQGGVPWANHLPLIGWLFSSHSSTDSASELMIFITPHIADAIVGELGPPATKPEIKN